MKSLLQSVLWLLALWAMLTLLHLPLLHLPYYWDEAGYYIPAAVDFYQAGLLIPKITLPVGHTPLVMVYLGLAWRMCGFSPLVTRVAMALLAAMTVASLFVLGRRVAGGEIAAWSAGLLALSPVFFAQSTLVHLDLAAALFTTLAVFFLLEDKLWFFALAASMAVLSKETAVVMLPVAWLYAWRGPLSRSSGTRVPSPMSRVALLAPLLPLVAWTLYYHHVTGFWTGNREYLSYNFYSTLSPPRIFWSLLRRIYELFLGGFNWLLTTGALVSCGWERKRRKLETRNSKLVNFEPSFQFRVSSFAFRLAGGLIVIYLLLLSVTGGAILPRYLLPIFPLFYLTAVEMVMRLPRLPARLICGGAAVCFVGAWFINPPYPFPFEDNLAYADFIRLHQQAAQYLEGEQGHVPSSTSQGHSSSGMWQGRPPCAPELEPSSRGLAAPTGGGPRILTAWPATDELTRPFLGYVREPFHVIAVQGFTAQDFAGVRPQSFEVLYLYSRKWEPPGNWVARFPGWLRVQSRYFDYRPQISVEELAGQYHLKLFAQFERRGQWVKIFRRSF